MILESCGIIDIVNKVKDLQKEKENLTASKYPDNMRIGEIVIQIVGYLIYLAVWIFFLYYAFCHNDIIWGIAIILFGLPMAFFYGIYLLAVRGDPRRRNVCKNSVLKNLLK
jgi:hypothetical protein